MKRPLFIMGICFFAGVWAAFSMPQNAPRFYISVAAAVTAALIFALRGRIKAAMSLCAVLLVLAAAFGFSALYYQNRIAPVLALAGKTVRAEGLVLSAQSSPTAYSYTVKASFPDFPGIAKDTLIVVRKAGEPICDEGDVISCRVRLADAPASTWYKSRGILLVGQAPGDVRRASAEAYRFDRAILRLRNLLRRNTSANLSRDSAPMVSAMVLGLANDMEPEIFSAVNRSGTAHLLTVSGLHLSVLAAFALGFFKKLKCPDFLGAALSILVLLLFTCLVGFATAVLRSFVMTALALSGKMLSRRVDSLSSLGASLIICCVFQPFWTLGFGLWLSAGSALGIILFSGKLTKVFRAVLQRGRGLDRFSGVVSAAAAVSVAAYAFTAPILLLMSGWLSIISPIANILISPFVPVVIIGGIFCSIFSGTSLPILIISRVTDFCAAAVISISRFLGGLPFAVAAIDESWMLILLFGICAAAAVLILFRADRRIALYALCLLVICFCAGDVSLNFANKNKTELVTLSGRDAALLIRNGEAVVLGTPSAYEISNLLKYMSFRGITRIPALIAPDLGEQIGSGILRLAAEYPIDCVLAPNDAFSVAMLEEALPGIFVYSGGYAELTALGGIQITTELISDTICITAGKNEIVKIRKDCDIMKSADHRVMIFNDGVIAAPDWINPLFEPVGAHLFGESRIALDMG